MEKIKSEERTAREGWGGGVRGRGYVFPANYFFKKIRLKIIFANWNF